MVNMCDDDRTNNTSPCSTNANGAKFVRAFRVFMKSKEVERVEGFDEGCRELTRRENEFGSCNEEIKTKGVDLVVIRSTAESEKAKKIGVVTQRTGGSAFSNFRKGFTDNILLECKGGGR